MPNHLDHRFLPAAQTGIGKYLVDAAGRPGGGGLLLLEAADQASAEALIRDDPMLRSGGVSWQLQRWVSAVGDLGVDG